MICVLSPFNPNSIKEYLFGDISCVPNINKSASSVNNLVKGLLENGQTVMVITVDYFSTNTARYEGRGIVVYVIGAKSAFPIWNYFPNLQHIERKIRKIVNENVNEISIIHAQWCYEYALAARHFVKFKPVVCTVRDFAKVVFRSINPFSSVYTFFAYFYWLYKRVIFRKILNTDGVQFIANSEYTRNLLLSSYPRANVTLIPNSIEDDKLVEHLPYLGDRKCIVSISMSLDDKRKNIQALVKAFSLFSITHKDVKLLLIGNYHNNKGVHKLASDMNLLGKIEFMGVLNRSQLVNVIDNCYLMVHPAEEETFGNILIEAMSRGVICLGGQNSGAVPYVLDNNRAGFLCDIDDISDIANKMAFITDNIKNFDIIQKDGFERVKNNFTNTVVVKQHIKLYNSCLDRT